MSINFRFRSRILLYRIWNDKIADAEVGVSGIPIAVVAVGEGVQLRLKRPLQRPAALAKCARQINLLRSTPANEVSASLAGLAINEVSASNKGTERLSVQPLQLTTANQGRWPCLQGPRRN